MPIKIKGIAWVFPGDEYNVDVHLIPPHSRQAMSGRPESDWAQYCMVPLDPNFPKKIRKGDIIVAGKDLGCGQDHYESQLAMRACRVGAIIAESFNHMFHRNSINLGLPAIPFPRILQKVKQGDELEIDLKVGTIKNLRSKERLRFRPFPEFLIEIIEAGGLDCRIKKLIEEGKIERVK